MTTLARAGEGLIHVAAAVVVRIEVGGDCREQGRQPVQVAGLARVRAGGLPLMGSLKWAHHMRVAAPLDARLAGYKGPVTRLPCHVRSHDAEVAGLRGNDA